MLTPPYKIEVLNLRLLPYSLKLSPTCEASSLVGTSTRTRILLLLELAFWSTLRRGNAKAAVFPVPVWAPARISLPFKISGIASFCISEGLV